MFCFNLLIIQGFIIYNVFVVVCYLLCSECCWMLIFVVVGVGIVLVIGGMYEMLIFFFVLLGSIILFIGGVIFVDYWFVCGGCYFLLQNVCLLCFNWLGFGVYVVGVVVVYFLLWIVLLVGIFVFVLVYIVLILLSKCQFVVVVEQEL